jgi:hypothetical protein
LQGRYNFYLDIETLYFNQVVIYDINPGNSDSFRIFINQPEDDVFFDFVTNATPSVVFLSFENLSHDVILSTSSPIVLFASDERRFGGWYQLRVSNDGNETSTYRLHISTRLNTGSTKNGSEDVSSYIVLVLGFASLMGSIGFTIKRIREARRPRVNPNSTLIPPRRIAPIYHVNAKDLCFRQFATTTSLKSVATLSPVAALEPLVNSSTPLVRSSCRPYWQSLVVSDSFAFS